MKVINLDELEKLFDTNLPRVLNKLIINYSHPSLSQCKSYFFIRNYKKEKIGLLISPSKQIDDLSHIRFMYSNLIFEDYALSNIYIIDISTLSIDLLNDLLEKFPDNLNPFIGILPGYCTKHLFEYTTTSNMQLYNMLNVLPKMKWRNYADWCKFIADYLKKSAVNRGARIYNLIIPHELSRCGYSNFFELYFPKETILKDFINEFSDKEFYQHDFKIILEKCADKFSSHSRKLKHLKFQHFDLKATCMWDKYAIIWFHAFCPPTGINDLHYSFLY